MGQDAQLAFLGWGNFSQEKCLGKYFGRCSGNSTNGEIFLGVNFSPGKCRGNWPGWVSRSPCRITILYMYRL